MNYYKLFYLVDAVSRSLFKQPVNMPECYLCNGFTKQLRFPLVAAELNDGRNMTANEVTKTLLAQTKGRVFLESGGRYRQVKITVLCSV